MTDEAQLWVKYRPHTLDDMVGLGHLKADASSWVSYENNSHQLRCGGVIFAGPPGTGKTTAAQAIAKDLLGRDSYSTDFYEFNASDDRGIAFVRDRLKPLAQQKAVGRPFKVINLDEADGLTREAQDAMRQVIELTSPHTLWILTCNRIGRIIPALRSRLPTYTFQPLEVGEADALLSVVIHEEGFPSEWLDAVPTLILKHRGDLRACLKTLQVCNPNDVDSLLCNLQDDLLIVEELYGWILQEDWDECLKLSNEVTKQGISRDEVIDAMHRGIIEGYHDASASLAIHQCLKHLLILGQWAARSPDWVAGDLLFLQSLIGDYQHRG